MLFSRNELKPLLHQVSTNDPDLTSLHLSHKKITNKQLLQISDALQNNTHITEIWLTNNLITDNDGGNGSGGVGGSVSVGYLTSVLETNRTVGEVYLGGNKIGAKGASSIANLLQKNHIITEIGLEDNAICDGGAKMLADALSHNSTLQTLKLQGNDIQTEGTLQSINELLKKNRDSAKKKFEKEHPELTTHKLKKPEVEKKKKKKRSNNKPRSGDKKGDDGETTVVTSNSRSGKKPQSSSRDGTKSKNNSNDKTTSLENSNAFLEERKKQQQQQSSSMENTNNYSKPATKLMNKFKGLGLGGGNKNDVGATTAGMKKDGMKSAAFV